MNQKFIFITGGVCSSLGKGLTAASIGTLLERKGLEIALLKLDPYLNVDPGTMNPFQHGEVYVTEDGAETDLDLGHYYRYTNSPLSRQSNATSGQIYNAIISKERRGDFLGNTVQVIPHITDEIKRRILQCKSPLVIVEIGGTVGDIESQPFLEAIRQFRQERPGHCLNIHLTYVPFIKAAGEFKTKPTQHSVGVLRAIGLFPDLIICRCEHSLPEELKAKISLFCNVAKKDVIDEVDVETSIYEVPLKLHEEKIDSTICQKLNLPDDPADVRSLQKILDRIIHPKGSLTIGIVGKYVSHQDAYKSIFEALHHGAIAAGYAIEIRRFEADKILDKGNLKDEVKGCDGYLIPGGFGQRGWEGKIAIAKWCREKKIPYFGICLGMQVLCVEYARHVADLSDANSTEIDADTRHPIISLLSEQENIKDMGGTMRLGSYPCSLNEDSMCSTIYGKDLIKERHRHRYEFNNAYKDILEKRGLRFAGMLDGGHLVEIVEVENHPWMIGVQFHPEFQSKPTSPHPLFESFIAKAIDHENAHLRN